MRRRLGSFLLLAAVALLLGACGSNDDESSATTQTTTGTQTETQSGTGTVDGIDPMDEASTDPVTVPATNEETALLTDVRAPATRATTASCSSSRNVLPGYDVRYVEKPVHADASGLVVPVAGTHVVQVRMENALDADLTQESAPPTYTGPQRFSPGTPEVVELVRRAASRPC